MRSGLISYAFAIIGVAVVAWVTSTFFATLGLASSALLFLLPVLFTSAQGSVGSALFSALLSGVAYNYFLLPPRFSFRIHGLDNGISLLVLVAVALVTSRLAARLRTREAEASERADRNAEMAALSAAMTAHSSRSGVQNGVDFLAQRHGAVNLLSDGAFLDDAAAYSSLDQSAAAWAIHNGDITGHGTAVMPAADWTFFPLAPKSQREGSVAALARPADGRPLSAGELEHLYQLFRMLGQFRDREALEAVQRDSALLEARDSLRRTFLASVAHDFRTPLTVISGRLELLAPNSAQAREALVAAKRLDRMMRDLLGAARLEQGSLHPKIESLDLVDAVSAACEDRATVPDIMIQRHIPADLPFVAADPVLLHHILVNLFDNALRFARSQVVWTAHQQGEMVQLSLSDDGPGIPEGEQGAIFARFQRFEGGDRANGSGLGLAIVKGFADAMDIMVTCETAATGGASFKLEIPCAAKAGA